MKSIASLQKLVGLSLFIAALLGGCSSHPRIKVSSDYSRLKAASLSLRSARGASSESAVTQGEAERVAGMLRAGLEAKGFAVSAPPRVAVSGDYPAPEYVFKQTGVSASKTELALECEIVGDSIDNIWRGPTAGVLLSCLFFDPLSPAAKAPYDQWAGWEKVSDESDFSWNRLSEAQFEVIADRLVKRMFDEVPFSSKAPFEAF